MREYIKKANKDLEAAVLQLYLIGLSRQSIIRLLGKRSSNVLMNTLLSDIHTRYPRPYQSNYTTYQAKILYLARNSGAKTPIDDLLWESLRLHDLRECVEALMFMQYHREYLDIPPEDIGYARFFEALLEWRFVADKASLKKKNDWRVFFLRYLRYIKCMFPREGVALGDVKLPVDDKDLRFQMAKFAAQDIPMDIAESQMCWSGESARSIVARLLADKEHVPLNKMALSILRLRFGLEGNKAYTLHEVAEMVDRSLERVRQIEQKSLRAMRRSFLCIHFKAAILVRYTVRYIEYDIHQQQLEQRESEEGLLRSDVSGDVHGKTISTPIEGIPLTEFTFSDRVLRCFRSENMFVIKDVTSKTRKDLLGIPNFGLRSLNETMEVLGRYGLHLVGEEVTVSRVGD